MRRNNEKYSRGSEWRKWDLHIHTPFTKLNCLYSASTEEEKWKLFCEKIEETDVSVFGITDYFSIENYLLFIKIFQKQYPESQKRFFPNIEFRIDFKNQKGKYIHFHVIFSNQEKTTRKITNFLKRLPLTSTDDKNKTSKYCTTQDLAEITYEKATVKIDNLKQILSSNFTEREYIRVGVVHGYGSCRPKSNDGRDAENVKELDKDCDMFFGIKDNVDFLLNKKEKDREDSSLPPKAVLSCSDCHSFDHLTENLGKKFTWIKADPTFEGLRQIIYEPEERVKIQENKPDEKAGYHVIKSVDIDHKLCKQKILLNSNLNTIIGGRSTGKSTLLELIASKINPEIKSEEFINNILTNVIIRWQDEEENANRDIEFFPQNYMHTIASNHDKKNKLIKDIIKEQGDANNLLKDYYDFCRANKATLQGNIDDLFHLQATLKNHDTTLKEQGDKSGLGKEIKNIEDKISKISKSKTFSKEDLDKFESMRTNISKEESFLKQLDKDKDEIEKLKRVTLFDQSFVHKFYELSEKSYKQIENIFEDIKKETHKTWEVKLSKESEELEKIKKEKERYIISQKNHKVFQEGEKHITNNKKYQELSERLIDEKEKLCKLTAIEEKISRLNKEKKELFQKTVDNHISYSTKISTSKENFSLKHKDITIKVERTFEKEKCENLLNDFINLRSQDSRNFIAKLINGYEDKIEDNVYKFLEKALSDNIPLKSDKEMQDLTKGLLTENWFSISYQLIFQNDTFEKMSDGKKAFVILQLLLEFSGKKCPILIDQPEDNLDNRAIYNELVTYIKQKKKNRQIILVTHNPNVVINADAEEVIVANQHGEDSKNTRGIKFQYISGSAENTKEKNTKENIILNSQGIREHLCEILEGGTEAFKKRENKYGIKSLIPPHKSTKQNSQ